MKTKFMPGCLPAAAMVLFLLVLQPGLLRAAGPLTPPGAPAPTMKSLQEIEPRTLIASLPYAITSSGSYYLSNSLTVVTGDGITISANGVTLDLDGFTITSAAVSATGHGIYIQGALRDISIVNGAIEGGVKDNGNGTFSGGGFAYGISATNATGVRVTHVSVSGCLVDGIRLNFSAATIAEKCTVVTVGNYGIFANAVDSCVAYDCGVGGIGGESLINCYGQAVYNGEGILGVNAVNCYGTASNNIGLSCNNGQNCIGYSVNSGGIYGLQINTCISSVGNTNSDAIYCYGAVNCYGNGGFAAVYAADTAIGCDGSSSSGYGIYTMVAENCLGYSYTFTVGTNSYAGIYASVAENCWGYGNNPNSASYYIYGIQADVVHNCEGFGVYGDGIHAVYSGNPGAGVVENSYGQSYGGNGVNARIANNCSGYSTNGAGIYATTAANNCYGESIYGDGLDGVTVNNCQGFTHNGYYGIDSGGCVNNSVGICGTSATGGAGIYGYVSVIGSYGSSSSPSGYGIFCSYVMATSLGEDTQPGALGIDGFIANSCYGYNGSGTSENLTYKYNMP